MNLAAMRTDFLETVAQVSDVVDDASIDAYLNRAYQFEIPADIGGEISENVWTLETANGTRVYDYPAPMMGVKGDAWISNDGSDPQQIFLDVCYDRAQFEDMYADPDPSTTGMPTAILFYGRQATLNPTPDAAYTITIPIRGGSTTALAAAGLSNELLARAVVYAAARDFCGDSGDEVTEARLAAAYERLKDLLMTQAHTRPKARRPARSF